MPLAIRTFTGLPLVGLLLLAASPATAQNWAESMVDEQSHDFGTVARGADVVHKFEITNSFKEDIVLKSVRSSCGCTSPSLENKQIKTYEKGYVVAKFNTRTFTGPHSATLTLKLEFVDATGVRRPGQVQLRVHGNIRGDIVFEPGSVDLGTVDQGVEVEKKVAVTYAGRSGWRVEDVRSTSKAFEVSLIERRRYGGSVAYDLMVRLKESAPPGLVKQQLVLVTNDSRNPRIPLEVQGVVQPSLSVAPATLVLGETPVGSSIEKRLIVRGKKPFRITAIECGDDGCFEFAGGSFDGADPARDRHLVTVTFRANEAGEVKRDLVFRTDLGESFTASCATYAKVIAPPEPAAAEEATAGTDTTDETLAQER